MAKKIETLMNEIGYPFFVNYNEDTKQFAIIRDRDSGYYVDIYGVGRTFEAALFNFINNQKLLDPFDDKQFECMEKFLGEEEMESENGFKKRRAKGYM